MKNKTALLLGAAIFVSTPAYATKYVYSPYVSEGEVEVEYKGEYQIDDDDSVDGTWEQKIGVGYGVTDYLAVEAYIEFEDEPGEDVETKAIELEAKFQFTEKDQYWIDSGFLAEYKYNTTGDPDEIEGKLLLAKSYGKFAHAANIELGTEVGSGSSDRAEYGLAWKSKYKYSHAFAPGFEYYADFGDSTKDYSDQKHRIGPVGYGHIGEGVEYELGILAGISDAAPDATLKLNLEYEF